MKKDVKWKQWVRKYRICYVLLAVTAAYYLIFQYLPIFWGFQISFKDMKIGSTIENAPWVGLKNYRYIFENRELTRLILNTLRISAARLVFTFFPPIILAVAVFDLTSARFRKISQTVIYLPHFFSWVIIYGIAFAMFSGGGLVNSLVSALTGQTVDFLTSSGAFVPMIVGTQIWKEAGWGTILYFAALTGVDPQLYEAARIDGAGPIARIRAVTLPSMLPIISFSLIMAIGNILNNDFEQILLFYNAAVYDVGDIIDTWVYRVGLGQMQYGVGSAVSMLKAVVSLVLILTANKVSKKTTGRGMF